MNKTHRIVWSAARGAFIVAHEKTRAHGQPAATRQVAALGVAAALLTFNSGVAIGATCSNTTISDSVTGPCTVASTGLSIASTGSITSTDGSGTVLVSGTTVSDIVNGGTISNTENGGRGIEITDGTTISGSITNTGTISASGHAIEVGNNSSGNIDAGTGNNAILNTGSLIANSATWWGDESGIRINSAASTTTSIIGKLVNSGTISADGYGINVNAETGGSTTVTGDIVNSGTISAGSGVIVSGTGAKLDGDLINSSTGSISGTSYGVNISSGATVTGKLSNAGTITGGTNGVVISGASVLKEGLNNSGTISATYQGIYVQDSAAIEGGLVNSGTITGTAGLIISNTGSLSGGINNSGTISATRNEGIYIGPSATLAGGLTNSGTISGYNGNAAILDKSGTLDRIVIAGNDTARFVGAVTAAAAQVSVGADAVYTLNDGNAFNVAGFTNSGTLKIGSASSATISGDFTNTGTLRLGVAGPSTYGKLTVGGTANLGGSSLFIDVASSNTLATNNSLSGVITAGSINGTFASVTDNSSLFNFSASYTGTQVNLNVTANSATDTSTSGTTTSSTSSTTDTGLTAYSAVVAQKNSSAYNAARVLDQIFAANPTGTVSSSFYSITGGSTQVSNAVTQTLPLVSSGLTDVKQDSLRSISRIVQARVESNRGLSAGDDTASDKYFWAKPFGSWANQGTIDGVAGYKATTAGIIAGVDAEMAGPWRLGGAFAYARSDVNGKSSVAPQSAEVDLYQLTAYGSYSVDEATDVNFQAAVGRVSNTTKRTIAFASTAAAAQYDSTTAQLGVGIGHSLALDEGTTFTPSLRADYTWIKDDAYTETGAGALDLNVQGRTADAFVVAVDGKLTRQYDDRLQLMANLGVGYDLINDGSTIVSAYAGQPGLAFTTYGVTSSPWLARGGAGLSYKISDDVELTGRYDVEYRQSFLNQTASVKLRWAF